MLIPGNKYWTWSYVISHYSIGVIQIAAGILLLVAVSQIRSFLVEIGKRTQVNQKQMIIHAVSFSLYLTAIVMFYIMYYIYTVESRTASAERMKVIRRYALITWIGTCYTNFIAQLCMIWIFMQFRHQSEPDRKTRVTMSADSEKTRLPSITRLSTFDDGVTTDLPSRTDSLNVYGDEDDPEENRASGVSYVSKSQKSP